MLMVEKILNELAEPSYIVRLSCFLSLLDFTQDKPL
jgi:hypothetical protein